MPGHMSGAVPDTGACQVGETRVDLLHLLEDLRDAYPGSLEETILTEILANALDPGADAVSLATEPGAATLAVVDNGRGMKRRELSRYHDLAATTRPLANDQKPAARDRRVSVGVKTGVGYVPR